MSIFIKSILSDKKKKKKKKRSFFFKNLQIRFHKCPKYEKIKSDDMIRYSRQYNSVSQNLGNNMMVHRIQNSSLIGKITGPLKTTNENAYGKNILSLKNNFHLLPSMKTTRRYSKNVDS